MEIPDRNQVQHFVRFYRNNRDYLQNALKRGRPFLAHILNEIHERDLPGELALLPVIESAFRPFAHSSKRAAGIWQFTPETGRHFDLKQNWWYDERRDVLAATDAALDYLADLKARFGDWKLALAGYNAGPGTVAAAIRQNRTLDRSTSFWHLDLPDETQSYVPKLLALSHVLSQAKQYGLELPKVPPQPPFQVVELKAPLNLALASELAGVEVKTLYRLNPGLNRWTTPPKGPERLLVPRETTERFRRRLAKVGREKRARWIRRRIPKSQIRVGEDLRLPPTPSKNAAQARGSPPYRRANGPGKSEARIWAMHKVQKGESLWGIARHFNVKLERLADWNNMAPKDTLHSGQRLAIWLSPGETFRRRSSAQLHYRVRKGDSLWAIAQEFDVPIHRIRHWNDLREGSVLHPGDRLTIYVDSTKLAEHKG